MSVKKVSVLLCTCERCGKAWIPRDALKHPDKLPVRCGNATCNSPYWNIPRTVKAVSMVEDVGG